VGTVLDQFKRIAMTKKVDSPKIFTSPRKSKPCNKKGATFVSDTGFLNKKSTHTSSTYDILLLDVSVDQPVDKMVNRYVLAIM
jgi:hypothetical protein